MKAVQGAKRFTRKASEPNPLVDPEGLLAQRASLRRGAEERLEIERKAVR